MAPASASPLLSNLLLFGRLLREAGIPVSPPQSVDFARALEHVDIGSRNQVFHTARSVLVHRYEDLRLFSALFDRFWRRHGAADQARPQKTPLAPRHEEKLAKQFTIVDYMSYKARQADPEIEIRDRAGTFSDRELLQHRDFSSLNAEELALIERLMKTSHWKMSERRTRRFIPSRRGSRISLRKMLRQVPRNGGAIVEIARLKRKVKRRPLILLADISGSMEGYCRVLLQFFFSVSHALGEVESFVFGTRLSRITNQLKIRNVDRALEEAASVVNDWAGGTRIGGSLEEFNRHWGRRVLRRGAVVVVISDGWERGDVSTLRREMRHLHHRCHRLIWLNPLLGHKGYQPLVEGMAAAMPFVDDFLPVHNLASLEQLAEHLASLPHRSSRKSASGPFFDPQKGHA